MTNLVYFQLQEDPSVDADGKQERREKEIERERKRETEIERERGREKKTDKDGRYARLIR